MASIFSRLASAGNSLVHAFNVFGSEEEQRFNGMQNNFGASYGTRPDRRRISVNGEKSIIGSVYTRLSIDAAAIEMRHVRLDDTNRYASDVDSGLNDCLTVEANIDQAATAFRQDIFMTMFEKGVVAIVPVDTDLDPKVTGGYNILSLRAGEIVQWFPQHVTVLIWNDKLGKKQEVTLPKRMVAIVENPLYSVMNEPNSTLQRLIRKLSMLDAVDEASSSGKLDLIIQLPYAIKHESRRDAAEIRAKDIESQLKGNKYGIAYTDATEKITQLNRPAENNLLSQVKFLTEMLYGQLGLTESVFTGDADEKAMLNYHNRTIAPVVNAVIEAMRRSFLTKTARTQKQSILYFRDPFKTMPLADIAAATDIFSRNEVLTPNEIRGSIGFKPNAEPKSDQLMNSNMPQANGAAPPGSTPLNEDEVDLAEQNAIMQQTLDELEAEIDASLAGDAP